MQDKRRTAGRRRRSAAEITLLDDGPEFHLASCCTLCIRALEPVMDPGHGEGWVFVLHLPVTGPLWLLVGAGFPQSVPRQMRSDRGTGDPREA